MTAVLSICFGLQCSAAASPPDAPTAATSAPQLYEAPGGRAFVTLPAGWTLVFSSGGTILMRGPNDQRLLLGLQAIIKDAPYQLQPGMDNGYLRLSLPNSSGIGDKFIAAVRSMEASASPPPQIAILDQQPFSAPAWFGQCARFNGRLTTAGQSEDALTATFCVQPVGRTGAYRALLVAAVLPLADADEQMKVIDTIVESYRLPLPTVRAMLSSLIPPDGITPDAYASVVGSTTRPPNPGVDKNNCALFDILARRLFDNTDCHYDGPQ